MVFLLQVTKFLMGTWKHGDLAMIICSALNMVVRVVFGITHRGCIREIINNIGEQAERRNIKWSKPVTTSFVALICGNCTWYTYGLITSMVLESRHYSVFDMYFTAFVTNYFVSIFETYYIFQLMWGIRRIFESINDELKQETGLKCIKTVRRCARAHYNAADLAEKINKAFGIVLAAGIMSNFIMLVVTVHSCSVAGDALLKHSFAFKEDMLQNAIWIAISTGGLIATVRTWNNTLIMVCKKGKTYYTQLV